MPMTSVTSRTSVLSVYLKTRPAGIRYSRTIPADPSAGAPAFSAARGAGFSPAGAVDRAAHPASNTSRNEMRPGEPGAR